MHLRGDSAPRLPRNFVLQIISESLELNNQRLDKVHGSIPKERWRGWGRKKGQSGEREGYEKHKAFIYLFFSLLLSDLPGVNNHTDRQSPDRSESASEPKEKKHPPLAPVLVLGTVLILTDSPLLNSDPKSICELIT